MTGVQTCALPIYIKDQIDLRVVNGMGQINLIFDMVVPFEYDEEEKNNLQLQLMEKLQEIDKRYQCVITMEHSYKAHV